MTTCEVCGRTAASDEHPCRFVVACDCWHGRPCDGSGIAEPIDIIAAQKPMLDALRASLTYDDIRRMRS